MYSVEKLSHKTYIALSVISITLLFLLSACGGGSGGDGESDAGGDAGGDGDRVSETDNYVVGVGIGWFEPSKLTINAGDTIIFRNITNRDFRLVNPEAGLDTGVFNKGERDFTFDKPGIFIIPHPERTTREMTLTVR